LRVSALKVFFSFYRRRL